MIIRPNAGFIIPTPRFVDVGMPKASVGASGRYQLIKYERGIEIERTPWFDNIILDSGLNRWGTGTIILGAAIGTGTSTPLATQTALETESHYTTTSGTGHNVVTALGSSPHNNTRTVVFRTTLGSLNGNYSEVGVGWATGQMFSRALILDGGGSPTTISVTSVQQLDIVYQLSVFPPLTDTGPTTVTISSVDYDVTGRAMNVNTTTSVWNVTTGVVTISTSGSSAFIYSGAIGAITASGPAGTTADLTTVTTDAYANNSNQRTGFQTYGLTDGNVSGGAQSSRTFWNGLGAFQYQFTPVIPKNSTKTMVLNYSINWARRP